MKTSQKSMVGCRVIVTDGNPLIRGAKGTVVRQQPEIKLLYVRLDPGQGHQVGTIFVSYRRADFAAYYNDVTLT